MGGWMGRLVSYAGRKVLKKAVAQAIPTYEMSVFKFSRDFCRSLQSSINRFWWGYGQDKRKIHWISTPKLCARKHDWGHDFRDM